MHDLTYANRILGSLKKEIGKKGKDASITIDASLSPLSHVMPQRLKDVFKVLSEEEGFTNIKLNVNLAALSMHCKECKHTWKSVKPTFKCPKCDSADFEIETWEEFHIDSIRVGK